MNNAQAQQKGKFIKSFDNVLWAAILAVVFVPLGIGIYMDVKFPHPLTIIVLACMILGPIIVAAIYVPIKLLMLRAINFRCTSCHKIPSLKTVPFVLEYSFCPRCHKPFITDPSQDQLNIFASPANSK